MKQDPRSVEPVTQELSKSDIYRAYAKLGILLGVVSLCIALIHFSDLKVLLGNTERLKAAIQGSGMWGPALFTAGSTILILIGMPRLLFCALGGMLFGFVNGLIFSQLASLIGAYGTFLFARWGTREWVQRFVSRGGRFNKFLENPGLMKVFLSRQIPAGGALISLLLGVSTVRHAHFLLGSLLGFLPEAIPAALIGSGAGKTSALTAFAQLLTAAVVVIAGGYATLCVISNYRNAAQKGTKQECPENP